MIITSICLSTVQVGFSFLSTNLVIGGSASISYGEINSTPGMDAVLASNSAYTETISASNNGNGYTTMIRAQDGTTLNNYLKFNSNADELWRIIGSTADGIKIVKDTAIATTSTSVWDSGSKYWVPTVNNRIPQQIVVTSLNNTSTLCNYLNSTYYLSLIDPSSTNYINPNFINHTPTWNMTPMYSSGTSNPPQYPTANKSALTFTAQLGASGFNGLPLGILTVEEMCMVSTSFDFASSAATTYRYQTFSAGWLRVEDGITELTMDQRHSSSSLSSLPSSYSTVFTITSSGVRYQSKSTSAYYRPTMYLNSNVSFTTSSMSSGTAGSETNPFILAE